MWLRRLVAGSVGGALAAISFRLGTRTVQADDTRGEGAADTFCDEGVAATSLDVRRREWPARCMDLLRPFPIGSRYLIGISGGRDSVALLHWLQTRGYHKLIVCHLEHGLRGRAGKLDALFVERLAKRLRLPFESKSVDVKARAVATKSSIETAARAARLDFFAQVARRRRCHTIFLGHHADDLVETFLFNLFRGAGLAGLSSLRESSTQRAGRTELTVVRPLLGVWREEIDACVREHALSFREDKTNQSLRPLRNRLRLLIIPSIEKVFGREIRRCVWRAAMIAAEENAWMNEAAGRPGDGLEVASLRAQPIALQRRLVHRWLREQQVAEVNFDLVERVRALAAPDALAAKTNLPDDQHARRRARKIFLEAATPTRPAKT